ncbi:methyltransferase domain-containing protein [Streptomyces bambusae]|uniref:rRNA adenine N-6-methyltransferase family protein n=1 Tax=Streptomyces bambusae TaxID=1550616 RepID=UPI001CFD6E8D|nr:rRNA adenine N-6-methyltransferase family protein [Streptomyces bambusae]MCB5167350.1 methyltransferase domain-containing protein [Streptomyces bambusae]
MSRSPRGFAGAGWLYEVFLAVPREHFVPDRVWWPAPREDGLHSLIDRAERPRAWLKAVYLPGVALITQLDDGRIPPTGAANGAFTSSISSSGVIVELLRHLDPRPGDRVLEIGTGTGYTTALLAVRVGAGNLVTVEIDPQLAARAAGRLAELDLRPLVIAGDGELGHAAAGPYDRIVATASVRRIPPAWLAQLAPGGVLIAPLDSPFGSDLLVRLEGDGTGGAVGGFVAQVEFMRVRSQREVRSHGELGWPAGLDAARWRDLKVEAGPDGQRIHAA